MMNAPFPRLPDVPVVLAALVEKEFNVPHAQDRRWEKVPALGGSGGEFMVFCKCCPRSNVKLVRLSKHFLTTRSWIWLGACEPCKVIYWDLTPREEPA